MSEGFGLGPPVGAAAEGAHSETLLQESADSRIIRGILNL